MKKAYVIWILPQAAKKGDGHVNRISSKLENISGSFEKERDHERIWI